MAELGAIAGLGMIVAFVLTIVLLPALLMVLRPSGKGMAEVGFSMLAPVDTFIHRRRRAVLAVASVAAVASLALLPQLRFDFDPLNLKSRTVELMTTLKALTAIRVDAQHDQRARPFAGGGAARGAQLAALPEVSRTVTLATFVRPSSRRSWRSSAMRQAPRAGPRRAAAHAAVGRGSAGGDIRNGYRVAAGGGRGERQRCVSARRLADALQNCAPLRRMCARRPRRPSNAAQGSADQVRSMLQAGPITLESLPRQLAADWVATDGRARIQVLPRGGQDEASLHRFA